MADEAKKDGASKDGGHIVPADDSGTDGPHLAAKPRSGTDGPHARIAEIGDPPVEKTKTATAGQGGEGNTGKTE
jgi:hypothetical protein